MYDIDSDVPLANKQDLSGLGWPGPVQRVNNAYIGLSLHQETKS